MKKLTILLLVLLLASSAFGGVPSVKDIVSHFPEEKMEAFLGGELLKFYSTEGHDTSSPAFDGTMGREKAVADYNNSRTFTSALVNFVPYPESWKSLSFEEKKLQTINTLLKISALKGIEYISHSAGEKPKVLFENAYALMENKKTKAEDPVFNYAPEEYSYTLNVYLKDNIFGGNNYVADYEIKGNEVFLTMTNTSDLKFLLFKAVSKEELDMCIDVVLTEEGIALYGMATVFDRPTNVKTPVTDVHLPTAFMRRITALRDWFVKEINR
ncbi:MAG: hypothetical protein KBS81_03515 [Spirochaetales bacterium]|nr:hypothetical protein [Candidatus Physcosoma equi]